MDIVRTVKDHSVIFHLTGRLDTVSASALEDALKDDLATADELVLDLEGLTYICSAGLRILLVCQKSVGKRGRFILCHVTPMVMEVLEMTGFTDFLTIEA